MVLNTRKQTCRYIAIVLFAVLIAAFFIAPAAADAETAPKFAGGEFNNAQELANAMGSDNVTVSGNIITLKKDINVTNQITLTLTENIQIIGGGHTIWRGGEGFFIFDVTSASGSHTFTLGDGDSALTIDGQKAKFSSSANTKGLIAVNGTGTTMVMNDQVTLTNSDVSNASVNSQPYDLHQRGKGVGSAVQVLHGAEFQMKGGKITQNHAKEYGAVFIIYSNAKFSISGGEISYNTVKGSGAGVYNAATMEMSGGSISYNEANNNGGGIYNKRVSNNDRGSVVINGGKIVGNTAKSQGGGICNYEGTVTMESGEISGNKAKGGAGILLYSNGVLNLKGGSITGNSANGDWSTTGGGIYFNTYGTSQHGTVNVQGTPSVYGNTANGKENNIHPLTLITITAPLENGAMLGISFYNTDNTNEMPKGDEKKDITNPYDTDYSHYFFADAGAPYTIIYDTDKKIKMAVGTAADETRVITWMSEGELLKKEELPAGTKLTYDVIPTKAAVGDKVYKFIGWSTDSTSTVGKDVGDLPPAHTDITYYAIFTEVPNSFTVQIQQPQNGLIDATPKTARYQQEIMLSNTPASGYQLQKYTVKTESGGVVEVANGKFSMPAGNVIVSAVFEEIPAIPEPSPEPTSSKPIGSSIWLTETPTPTETETITPTETQPTETPTVIPTENPKDDGFPWWILVVVILILAAAGIGAGVYLRNR